MLLTLSVLTYRNQPPPQTISAVLDTNGGTIGRLDDNALVLPDPDRIISRSHARVEFRTGSYFITALGQNPIDLNGNPIGFGESTQLSSGDKLTIGEYCILADIQLDDAKPTFSDILSQPSSPSDFFDSGSIAEPGSDIAFGIPLTGGSSPAFENKQLRAGPNPLASPGAQQRDQVPGFLEPLTTAKPIPKIPDDYDFLSDLEVAKKPPIANVPDAPPVRAQEPFLPEDPFAETTPIEVLRPDRPQFSQTAEASAIPSPDLPAIAPVSESIGPKTSAPVSVESESIKDVRYAAAVREFLDAAGVPELESHALADPNFVRNAGELLRDSIAGLLKSLIARALTKGELRLDMTMLAPVENNPLKFSPNAHEALMHLLAPRSGSGYLPPLRAVREAYQDLEAHNLAVMAGMRSALLGVLQRFDPGQLEKRLASRKLLDNLIPANRKARMWDLVAEQHADIVREAQDEFDRIFGHAFRDAYQEQIEKLRLAAKPPSSPI